ncbi:MAG: hypothetical protein LBJ33_12435 [Pseudomonas putida]|jgi:hypothetical protein|nr:hypothetical protein [Pseudomonas putida]
MTDDEQRSRHQPVEEDMAMQQRVWRFERLGWYLLSGVVLLALAGVFGRGPLSHAQASSADGRVLVQYARLSRSGVLESLQIRVRGPSNGQVQVLLDGDLFREASLETVQPQPLRSRSEGQGLKLQLGTGTDGTATLYLSLRAETPGRLQGRVSLGPDSEARFSTFIYP